MKKAFKIIGLALLGLVAVICLSAMIINTKGVPTFAYSPNPETDKLQGSNCYSSLLKTIPVIEKKVAR